MNTYCMKKSRHNMSRIYEYMHNMYLYINVVFMKDLFFTFYLIIG